MKTKLLVLCAVTLTTCLQGMEQQGNLSIPSINQANIDKTTKALITQDKKARVLQIGAAVATLTAGGVAAKKFWDYMRSPSDVQSVKIDDIDKFTEEKKDMYAAIGFKKQVADHNAQIEAQRSLTWKQYFQKGASDYWTWAKSSIPWFLATSVAYKVAGNAERVVESALPSFEKIVDNFRTHRSIMWFIQNRTQYNLTVQRLLNDMTAVSAKLLIEEKKSLAQRIEKFAAAYESGEELSDNDIEQYNILASRFEQLNAIKIPTAEDVPFLINRTLISTSLFMRDLERIIGFIDYIGSKINPMDSITINANKNSKNSLLTYAESLRVAISDVLKDPLNTSATEISVVRTIINNIQREFLNYVCIEESL